MANDHLHGTGGFFYNPTCWKLALMICITKLCGSLVCSKKLASSSWHYFHQPVDGAMADMAFFEKYTVYAGNRIFIYLYDLQVLHIVSRCIMGYEGANQEPLVAQTSVFEIRTTVTTSVPPASATLYCLKQRTERADLRVQESCSGSAFIPSKIRII